MHDPVFLDWVLYRTIIQVHAFETLKEKCRFEILTVEQSFHNNNFESLSKHLIHIRI